MIQTEMSDNPTFAGAFFDRSRHGDSDELFLLCERCFSYEFLNHMLFCNDNLGLPPAAVIIKANRQRCFLTEEIDYICAYCDAVFMHRLGYTKSNLAQTGIEEFECAKVYSEPKSKLVFHRSYAELVLLKRISKIVDPQYWEMYPNDIHYAAAAIIDASHFLITSAEIEICAQKIVKSQTEQELSIEQAHEIALLILNSWKNGSGVTAVESR